MSALRASDEDRLLSVQEAADLMQISAYTLREWARDGKVPAIRLGKLWRFRRLALLDWVESQERGG